MDMILDSDCDQQLPELNIAKRKLLLQVLLHKKRTRNYRRRQWHVRPLNQERKDNGEYYRLVQRLDIDAEEILSNDERKIPRTVGFCTRRHRAQRNSCFRRRTAFIDTEVT